MKRLKQKLSLITLSTIILGLGLSMILYWTVDKQEHQKIFAELQRDVDELAISFRSELELAFFSLHSIRGLFDASQHVDHTEFRAFTTPFIKDQPGIQALEWVPRVTHNQRERYENEAKQAGYKTFQITEQQTQENMIRAKNRQEYYPVYFVEPFENNKSALGFDLASNTTRLKTLEQSRDSGELRITSRITLVQETENQYGILAFFPIFKENPNKGESKRRQLRGFALGVFHVGDIFNAALQKISRTERGIDMQLIDSTKPENRQLLTHHKLPKRYRLDPKNQYQKLLPNIGGRNWLIIATPTETYISNLHTWTPYMGLTSGLIITAILALFLQSNANKTLEVEQLIRQRTAELREREEENRIIVETTVNALITINDKGIIESFNPAAEKMFEYSLEEVIGKNVKMLMPEPRRSAHDSYLKNYATTGVAKIIGIGREVEGQRKDGSIFPLYLAVGKREIKQKRKYVGFLLDITKQKEAEKLKGEFVSTVSHELRTPLTSIKGTLGLVAGGVMGQIPDKALNLIKKALQNTDRLTLLINDLLDIEKIQSGSLDFNMCLLQTDTLLEKAITSNQGYADKYGVQMALKNKSQRELTIHGDENRLMQVLSNLISNAIKFSPEQGKIELDVTQKENWVRISVIDHGPGIPEAFHTRIFQKFAQADSSDTRQKGGTGLGLAISKTIVEKHGGTIGFETKAGEGTVFYVDLPMIPLSKNES